MTTVSAHYEDLLADLYPWMLGDFAARVETELGWLRGVVDPGWVGPTRPLALDLGAGAGADAIALARLGFGVVAVDASAKLGAEIRRRAADAGLADDIEVVESDLVAFLERRDAEPANLVVCIGDTLTHLASPETVQRMLRAARAQIARGGRLALSYRDLSNELRELDRFFLVRSDESRVLTCFVEYLPERAIVHDLVNTRTNDGWDLRKSCYPKLRLPVDRVRAWLADAGFGEVQRIPCGGGLVGLVAR